MLIARKIISPVDSYEWVLRSIDNGELSPGEEDIYLSALRKSDWITREVEALPEDMLIRMYDVMVGKIESGEITDDTLTLSRLYYSYNARQIDTSKMRDLIGTIEFKKVWEREKEWIASMIWDMRIYKSKRT